MPTLAASHLISDLQKVPKEISFSYLYDKKGSDLYERITELEEYYPFLAEENLLKQHAEDILEHIPPGTVVVELGCGTARKTAQILNALMKRDGRYEYGLKLKEIVRYCRFAGIDVSASFLEEARANLLRHVAGLRERDVATVQADYIEGLREVRRRYADEMLCILWLGSSVGNLSIRAGGCSSYKRVVLTFPRVCVRYPSCARVGRGGACRPDERLLMEVSRKFTVADVEKLASDARFYVQAAWRNRQYGIQLMVPAEEALRLCWRDTDAFFAAIPDWAVKPIDVRHPFCFYYGHVSSFSKMKVLPDAELSQDDITFSRGIDPNVLDPSKCHKHPEVPSAWPSRKALEAYVARCRDLMLTAVTSRKASMRHVSMGLEHERMHLETLAYMQCQERRAAFERASAAPPPPPLGGPRKLPKTLPAPDVVIPAGDVVLGVDVNAGGFVWDNEGPPKSVPAGQAFAVAATPVSVGDFVRFIVEDRGYQRPELWQADELAYFQKLGQVCPATWSHKGGEFYVHVSGATRHWAEVADEPALVSLAEAQAYCAAHGWRVMSEAEYHRVLAAPGGEQRVRHMRDGGWEWTSSVFEPFPGFKAMPEYPDYSADFFDGLHFVLKGSSHATHPCMLRDSFRNFYQRLYPYVFAKFRCCKDA
eukprot:jgi/Mesen1/8372/ME000468S07806